VKKNRGKSRRQLQVIQVWTYDQVRKALPYISSIVRSLREHRLEAVRNEVADSRLAERPGRPSRSDLLEHELLLKNVESADAGFDEALDELHTLDIYCLDPVQGLALIPFAYEDELAWYVYELYGNQPIESWRYHRDPMEKRRPIGQVVPSDGSVVV
jgi:hypothetical protein